MFSPKLRTPRTGGTWGRPTYSPAPSMATEDPIAAVAPPEADAPEGGDGPLLDAVREIYERGQYLQAFRAAAPLGPLQGWRGLDGLILAGRLANQLGDGRLGDRLHVRAHHRYPESGEAWFWAATTAWSRLGAYAARALLRRGIPPGAPPEEVLGMKARLASELGDLDEAERLHAEALALAPSSAWIVLQGGFIQAEADDHAAALETAERALALRPWYRPAVDFRARTLVVLGREDEAIPYLEEAIQRLEGASTCAELLQLQLERGAYDAAEGTLERIVERTPIRSRAYEDWLESRRSDVAYFRGDVARAVAHARRSRSPFYEALADRLESARSGRRVVLPVPFVRQHDKTCAPATLSAICAFHGVPADHLGIAEAICYDGTPDHAERRWAQDRGFTVREFQVTWESAVALVDLGLPFTLTMVEPGNGHLVAVAGYDEARGVLLLRDPSLRSLTEVTRGWLEDHRSSGPRGMALAPPGRAEALTGLELPDAALYDLYHQVQAALVGHDRPAAAARAAELAGRAPRHRLALQADRTLAAYDGSQERELAATGALLESFPDDVNLRVARQGALASLGRRQDRIAYLRAESARSPHPLLAQALGDALQFDARDLAESAAIARSLVRKRPRDGLSYHLLGDALWTTDARDEALHAYRVAACLDRTNDHFADAYFRAGRVLGRTEEAVRFLRGRYERYGGKSHRPAVTLAEALGALDLDAEALALLDAALARRPDDGELLLYAARAFALAGRHRRGAELLERARGASHEADVLRSVALLEELAGDLPASAAARVRVAELEPLNVGAAEGAARLLAETRDRKAAVEFLRRAVERFPHHQGLGRALISWLDQEPPAVVEAELRRFLAAAPSDAWAHRELALHLSRHGDPEAAQGALEVAAAIEPESTALLNVRATLARRAGRLEEARAALRASLRKVVDQDWALDELMELAPDGAARAEELRFLHDELVRQVTFGDAMLAYQRHGAGVLAPEPLLATLREAHAARPDLWHAWVALARQLVLMERTAEARDLLEGASRRFPLLPRLWLELGLAHRAHGEEEGWRRALEHALELNPGWRDASFKLAEALQAAGEFEAARAVLVRALRHAPSDGFLHGWLADALLGLDRTEEAVEELERALRLEPDYPWALARLTERCKALGREALPRELAEELLRERPLDARAWLLAARVRHAFEERLAAVDRALAVAPTWVDAVALRIELLAGVGRYDEAVQAVTAPPWQGPPPRSLRLEAARLAARSGRAAAARVALDALLEAEPDFAEAWEQAVEWHDEAARRVDCVHAARQLVRLAPHRSSSHGCLALALLAEGDRAAGKEALRRAVQLDPAYTWAVRRLFGLRLEDRELDGAAELLPLFERHFEEPELQLRRIELAVARSDRTAAAAAFEALAGSGERWQLEAATPLLVGAKWGADVDAILSPRIAAPGGTRAAGYAWYRWAAKALSRRKLERRLNAALAGGDRPEPALAGAFQAWLEGASEAGDHRRVRRLLRRHGARLALDLQLWGTIGYALSNAGEWRRAVEWLRGGRQREGVEAWMLLNLSLALCHRGRLGDAAEVSAEALRLEPDDTRARHLSVVAAEAALRGEVGPQVLFPPEGEKPGGVFNWLAAMARALRAGLTAADGPAGWRAAAPRLAEAAAVCTLFGEPPFVRRLWWRALAVLARHLGRGGPATAGWFLRGLFRAMRGR